MDSKMEELKRLAESLARPRRMPVELNPEDFTSSEQFEKARGPRVAVEDKKNG